MNEAMGTNGSVAEVRRRIQFTLEQYFKLEAELQKLEKDRFRVCIFGSARTRPEEPVYQTVYETARMLAELNIDIVTGGGPGLMEAANRGVFEAEGSLSQSIGLPIELPRSQELANRHLDIKSEHKRFSSRLDEFMRLSHAVIVAPGGIGTLLELVYVWQLIQVGMVSPRPVVLLGREMWAGLLNWMHGQMLGGRFISEHDFDWVHCVDQPHEALEFILPELEKFRAVQAERPGGEERVREATLMLDAIRERQAVSSRHEDPRMLSARHTG